MYVIRDPYSIGFFEIQKKIVLKPSLKQKISFNDFHKIFLSNCEIITTIGHHFGRSGAFIGNAKHEFKIIPV